MNDLITILLVDDHEVVRQGVRAFFEAHAEFEVVGEAKNGAEAVKMAEEHIPNVVLMDLIMPGMDGVEATRLIKNISPRTQIVVFVLHPHVAARVILEIQGNKENEFNPLSDLTNREMEILKLIADGSSNNEIANHLVISMHTVKGHVSNILSKLHLADRTQAAVYAWQKGVVRRE